MQNICNEQGMTPTDIKNSQQYERIVKYLDDTTFMIRNTVGIAIGINLPEEN